MYVICCLFLSAYIAYSGAENPLLETLDLSIVSHCHFDLRKYPWDIQVCNVEMRVSKTKMVKLVYRQTPVYRHRTSTKQQDRKENCLTKVTVQRLLNCIIK